jgi:TP901 family phage tail tape measure protein
VIILANKEIYRLDIKVGVSGDSESKSKLTAVEKMAQQIEKKTKVLSKLTANVTTKINDQASSKLEKLTSKVNKAKNATMTVTAKLKDEASSSVDKIQKKTSKLKEAKLVIKAKDEATKTVNKIEDKVNGWIKTGAKKVIAIGTAGVLAAGGFGIGESIKTFSEYEKGLSNVKAVTNATSSQMMQLDATAKKLGSTTAWSARNVTQAEELLGQAGFSVDETISALPGLLNLASAGDLDLAAATDIASGTLKAFSLNAKDAGHIADVLALSASATNSDVTDLGEAMKYCAPVSQSLGISLEDTAAAVGLLSNANIKGSQSGTVLRQTMARLASPTKEALGMMKKYGINAFDAQGNMKPLSGVVDNLNSSLKKLTSQQRADVISTIFGTESMSGVLSLMNQGGKSVSDLSQQLKESNGAAQKMADTKLDNLNGQWIKLKASVEHMQITLGEKLAPYAKQFVTWLTGKMPAITEKIVEMVDYISKHTNEIKSMAEAVIGIGVAFTALSAVGKIGNALSGISSLITLIKGSSVVAETASIAGGLSNIGSIASLLPAIFSPAGIAIGASVGLIGAAVVAENDLMKKSITTTTEELGPLERVMNELNGHLNKSKKEMMDLGLIYDDFGDDVSDNFKKNAQDASKSLLKLETNINRLTKSNKFDDANNNQLKNWVNDMAYEGINAIKEKQSQVKSELQKTFSLDGVTSSAEQGTLDYIDKFFDEGVNRELEIRNEMYEIGDRAIQDHGKLLDSDIKQLKEKAAELQQIKLEYANAESAGEQAYARSKFKSAAERVTGVDGASELLQERAKEHQKAVDDAKANYDKTIAITKTRLKDPELSSEDRTTLENQLTETTAARDKSLKEAEDAWKSDLETLYQAYPKARGLLNDDTGAKFTDGEIKSRNTMDKIQQSHSGLESITKSGVYALENNTTHDLETLYVSIDETTGKIKGLLNGANGDIGAYSDSEKEKLLSLQEQYSNTGADLQSLVSTHAMLNPNNQVFNGTGSIIGELKNVQTETDGTKAGILDLNKTPCIVTADINGAITSIQKVDENLDNINGRVATALINVTSTTRDFESLNEEKFFTRKNGYATGTNNATPGIHPVAENGFEIVYNKQNRLFNGGEKVMNHQQSKSFLENQQNNEPFQVKQGQYQLVQPQQVQLAGVGGNNIQVDVQVNGRQDVEGLIVAVTQEVGQKIREAFDNIKK